MWTFLTWVSFVGLEKTWGQDVMPHFKYLAYIAIICAVLLDLYSAKPDTSTTARIGLDAVALLFAAAGLGGLAMGATRVRRP